MNELDDAEFDLVIIGAGTAGIPAAIAAAERGTRTLLVEKASQVGGTLHVSGGQMSAGGTKMQERLGISDTSDAHFADIEKMTVNVPDMQLVRRAVDEAPGTIDWLDELGFDFDDDCPAASHFNVHDPYSAPRVYWGPEFGVSILDVIVPELDRAVSTDALTLVTDTVLWGLVVEDDVVVGARLRTDGREVTVACKVLLLASGGYGSAPELFQDLSGYRLVSAAMPTSTGDGIRIARDEVHADTHHSAESLPTFGGLEDPDRPHVSLPWDTWPVLTPQLRQPWEVFVNNEGRRFVREDEPDVQAREAALRAQPETTFWVISDAHIRSQAPPLMPTWDQQDWDHHAQRGDIVVQADTLEQLAERTDLPTEALVRTIADYNQAVATGRDGLGRAHLPAPIEHPPFTALRNHATTLRTHAGLAVDDHLRVLNVSGDPVAGLYAVGEVLGGVTMSGDGFAAGMSVTPALSLGRWAGRTLP